MAPLPMVRWPLMPACPARMAWWPMVVLPEMPTWATSSVWAPTTTLWPMCTIFVGFDACLDPGFAEGGPIDGVVGTDLHIVVDSHNADLIDFAVPPVILHETVAVAADDGAGSG
jgi:hypothetical protein